MRKSFAMFFILICIIYVVVGCGGKNDIQEISQGIDDPIDEEDKVDEVDINLQDESFNLIEDDIYSELYNLGNDIIILFGEKTTIKINTKTEEGYISNTFSSVPVLSPDNKRLAFISPYEFELLGELHVYNIDTKEKETIINRIDIGNQDTVKKVEWLDDRYLLTIIGYGYGTVSRGGSLYMVDTNDNSLKLLIAPEEERTEIMDFYITDEKITIIYAKHDEDYMEYEAVEEVFIIRELTDSIN